MQVDQPRRGQGRARQPARQHGHDQRARRGAKEARRVIERDPVRSQLLGGYLAGMASEEMDGPMAIPVAYPRGRYLLLFDPLDGSSNIDVNVSIGTIFSVLPGPSNGEDPG